MSEHTEPAAHRPEDLEPEAIELDTAAPRSADRPPRTKLFAALVLIAASLFGAAVVFGGLWLTGSWEGPSGDDPAESVDGFLTALLTEHDAKEAAAYTCASQSSDLGAVVEQLDSAEESAQFSWSGVETVEKVDSTAVVTAKITHQMTRETATWTFALVTGDPDDAWRVCGIYPDTE